MEIFKPVVFALLTFALVLIHAQNQLGFISLDCGLPRNDSYIERASNTGLKYISDAPFIYSGVSKTVTPEYKAVYPQQLEYLRSFPEGIRNCYRINVTKETKYLIRANFLYGNYDGKNTPPTFDLHLGANLWEAVKLFDVYSFKEIIHVPLQDYVRVCLVNTRSGTPFISALEIRPLRDEIYVTTSGSLALSMRLDMGSSKNTYRYPDDVFDRIWWNNDSKWTQKLNTTLTVDTTKNIYQPPAVVMSTAATAINGSSRVVMFWDTADPESGVVGKEFYVYMHFVEVEELEADQNRAFSVIFNGKLWSGQQPVVPPRSRVDTLFSTAPSVSTDEGRFNFTLVQLENSTLPPIINAFEVYSKVDFSKWETDQDDVDAITNVKSVYGVKRNWDGDPCGPISYMWEGLNCSNDDFDLPRITSLNLSSSGLNGDITSHIAKLTMLQSLDLSNNSFTGSVPDFLSQLPYLKVLNLERNDFTGSIPVELVEKSNNGSLSLSVGENQNLCVSLPCKKKKQNSSLVIPIIASICGISIIMFIAISVHKMRTKKPVIIDQEDMFGSKKRQFTYDEIVKMTNNFEKRLGKGGCGDVYKGSIDDRTTVAVKMISLPTVVANERYQDDRDREKEEKANKWQLQQFQSEIKTLMTVYHGNLTSLVGYCNEGTKMALIYEYMENGDLQTHLSGEREDFLSWEKRLQIAKDAAQGLEYLHNGCKPPIIHRDVKLENILLNKNFGAKIADFGLSRFYMDDATHIQTQNIAGTTGYIDPEAVISGIFTEKSDVHSFGVVLLQIITGQPAIMRKQAVNDYEPPIQISIRDWIKIKLADNNGDITSIVDPRFQGDFEINTVYSVFNLAYDCISRTSSERPGMSDIVNELRNCLKQESDHRRNYNRGTDHQSVENIQVFSRNATSEVSPLTTGHSAYS